MEDRHNVQLTDVQLYEINDAIAEVITRMITKGQTHTELKYKSLEVLWSVKKQLSTIKLGTSDTPGLREMAPDVEAAIRKPTILKDVSA